MARIEKTVFISYRRMDGAWALSIYSWLTQHGYDVFIDYEGIASGAFGTVIVENILARAHFLIILSPTALDRCDEPSDWLRREIETAMQHGRNIVPLLVDGFSFRAPNAVAKLTGLLIHLSEYNGLDIALSTFEDKMRRLSSRFLNVTLPSVAHPPAIRAVQVDAVLHTASAEAIQVAKEQQAKAEAAPPAKDQPTLTSDAQNKLGHRLAHGKARPAHFMWGTFVVGLAGILAAWYFGFRSPSGVGGICETELHQHSASSEQVGELLARIGHAMGANVTKVRAVACPFIPRVESYYFDGSTSSGLVGEYIFFNPGWLREVTGTDEVQAIALFGHELGHLINRDFTANRHVAIKEKELAADKFAGCAVRRLRGDWAKLEELYGRLRTEESTSYPGAERSIAAARQGYESC